MFVPPLLAGRRRHLCLPCVGLATMIQHLR
jgi:hypothetical protein